MKTLKFKVTGTKKDPLKYLGENNIKETPKAEPVLPSVKTITVNAMKSVGSAISSLLKKEPLKAESEEATKRLEICRSCEFFIKTSERCSKCGCFMALKTHLRAEKCPVGRW